MSDITDILVAREPKNSRNSSNSIERFDDIQKRLDEKQVWTQEREDIEWLCREVEWLRSAYVVHCRKVVEANPVRTFADEMLIANLRAQRNKGRSVIALAGRLAASIERAVPVGSAVWSNIVDDLRAFQQASELKKNPQQPNGDQA